MVIYRVGLSYIPVSIAAVVSPKAFCTISWAAQESKHPPDRFPLAHGGPAGKLFNGK
jgi:hypothetical protein